MLEIRKTDTFSKWIDGLRDIQGRARVLARIERLSLRKSRGCESSERGRFGIAD